jgi:hypothetical protein
MMKSTFSSALKFKLPGMLYAVVEPSDRKSVTCQLPAPTTAVPESDVEAMLPDVAVVYVKLVVVGTVPIV